jgi:hypothetical protein
MPVQSVDYIGRPFPIDEADRWYGQLAKLGFNSVRLITNWESIQPYRPGSTQCNDPRYESGTCYDLEYLSYYENLIQTAKTHGIYVLIDMHQDMFSRFLMSYYNENPLIVNPQGVKEPAPEGSLESYLFSLLPPYSDWARGHGAPKWVVETCLPEKNLDSPGWGIFRGIGSLVLEGGGVNPTTLLNVQSLLNRFDPNGEIPYWFPEFLERLSVFKNGFEPNETSDFLPLTPWLIAGVLSLDVDRCFASLFAGDTAFPNLKVDGDGYTKRIDQLTQPDQALDLKEALQGHYERIWRRLAQIGGKYDHVIGYDVMNEPVGAFVMLAVSALYSQGLGERIKPLMLDLLGELGQELFDVIQGLNLLPVYDLEECNDGSLEPDEQQACEEQNEVVITETNYKWGMMDEIDLGTAIDLNLGVDASYLQPFYERMGQAIEEEDPSAIIWFESATSLRIITGPLAFWDRPLTKPQGISQLVFAPHWYPDIYPRPGIGSPARNFQDDEWLYRDFTESLHEEMEKAPAWFGNIPVVFGEFGTYFNFNGIDQSKEEGYRISAHVLNRYYEAFEDLGLGNMVWCFSAENDDKYGELWNHENFSIIDPNGDARGWSAYVRTYVRSASGKPIHQKFYSPFHFWDPIKGIAPPHRRFEFEMEHKESDAPTEVYVPLRQYPEGFYVWLSDGQAYYDEERQILYWYPHAEDVGIHHRLMIQPALDDREHLGWRYYYQPLNPQPFNRHNGVFPENQSPTLPERLNGSWVLGQGDFSTTYAEEMWPW